jgi:hypothetical protein
MIMLKNDDDDNNDDILLYLCMTVVSPALRGEGPPAEEVSPKVVMNGRVEGPRYQTKRQLRGGHLRSCIVYSDLTLFRFKYNLLNAGLQEFLHLHDLTIC